MSDNERMPDETTVFVCEECLTASCWYGEFYCEDAKGADITVRTVGELRELKLENEQAWSDEVFLKIHGHLDRPPRDVRDSLGEALDGAQAKTRRIIEQGVEGLVKGRSTLR